MEKRVVFRSAWLPYALVLPQIAVTIVFFFWPAFQAAGTLQLQDAFGLQTEFVGLRNFAALLADEHYLHSFRIGGFQRVGRGKRHLDFASARDHGRPRAARRTRLQDAAHLAVRGGAGRGRSALGIPVRAVGRYRRHRAPVRRRLELGAEGRPGHAARGRRLHMEQISYNFLFFLAGLQSIPKSLIEAAAIDGAGPTRRFWTIVFPLLSPTTFFLLVVNIVYAFFETFGVIDATTQGGPRATRRSLSTRSTTTA